MEEMKAERIGFITLTQPRTMKVGIGGKFGIGERHVRQRNTQKVTLPRGNKWQYCNLRVG